jgi:hypothetical protein
MLIERNSNFKRIHGGHRGFCRPVRDRNLAECRFGIFNMNLHILYTYFRAVKDGRRDDVCCQRIVFEWFLRLSVQQKNSQKTKKSHEMQKTISANNVIIAQNEQRVYNAGKQAEYDAFWDALQNYGKRTEYSATFALWNIEYIRPKYKVAPTQSNVGSLFNNNKKLLAVEKDYFDFSQITNLNADYICNACDKLLVFEDCGLPALDRYARCWRFCGKMHTIEVLRSNENTTFTYTFENCSSLENITIEGVIGQDISFQWCTKLTRASIESIVNHLSENASGKTLTLSKTAVDNAFYGNCVRIDEETGNLIFWDDVGSLSIDWENLTATKPNWQITLV